MISELIPVGLDMDLCLSLYRNSIKLYRSWKLERFLYVILFLLRACVRKWLLLIYPCQFWNILLYWPPGIIQSLLILDQVKQFILASGYVTDEGTIYPWSSLHNTPHSGTYTLTIGPSIESGHLKINMVDIAPSGAWLIIVSPSGYEHYIYV